MCGGGPYHVSPERHMLHAEQEHPVAEVGVVPSVALLDLEVLGLVGRQCYDWATWLYQDSPRGSYLSSRKGR